MKLYLVIIFFCISQLNFAQNIPGIHFQGIARNSQGLIIANKQMNIKVGLYKDSIENGLVYEEIKSIKTNALGLFFVNIGKEEAGKIMTSGNWNTIDWELPIRYIKIEIDPENDLQFISLGYQLVNASPYALYAYTIQASNINGTLALAQGGTGTNNLKDLKIVLGIDKINNTPDSLKPITKTTLNLISQKLNNSDTLSLSNRINQKLNKVDTLSLSNRINQLNQSLPGPKEWGCFYDTSKQTASINTATAVNWGFAAASSTATVSSNTAGQATRINLQTAGSYKVYVKLQFIKPEPASEEISIWIRKNSAAYPNTHQVYTIQGAQVKNAITAQYYLDLGEKDYIEVFYSVKGTNTQLVASPAFSNPSRPMIPSAYLIVEKIN